MNSEDSVLVNKNEYERLLEDSMFLDALEQVGVADTDIYVEAQELMAEWAVQQELNNG